MQIVSLEIGETLNIGDEIEVTVYLRNAEVRVGIEAPSRLTIQREELVRSHARDTGSDPENQ